jgi:hypothetical protein
MTDAKTAREVLSSFRGLPSWLRVFTLRATDTKIRCVLYYKFLKYFARSESTDQVPTRSLYRPVPVYITFARLYSACIVQQL